MTKRIIELVLYGIGAALIPLTHGVCFVATFLIIGSILYIFTTDPGLWLLFGMAGGMIQLLIADALLSFAIRRWCSDRKQSR